MNIVNLVYKVSGVLDTPTSVLSQRMTSIGHNVCYYNGFYFNKSIKSIDWVASYHENVDDWDLLFKIKNKFGCKTYIHLEWLMPWIYDIYYCDIDWGYRNLISFNAIQKFKNRRHIWENADIRTCASKHFIKPLQNFFNSSKEIFVKKPGADELLAGCVKQNLIANHKYDVITVSRLEPHKKVKMIAKGLVKSERKIKWLLCGNGSEYEDISNIVKNSNTVSMSYIPFIHGFDKFRAMSFAKISIHAWNGIPPIEGILVNCFPLFWNNLYQNEYFDNLGKSFENYLDLANKINDVLDNYDTYSTETAKNKKCILSHSHEFGTVTQEAQFVLDKMKNG